MIFAQLTDRESLRDIEACLSSKPTKLYHIGLRGHVSRSALADANESRWRIYAEFAQALTRIARRLYAQEPLYALGATAINLCLSLFPWASFRQTKAAVKLHTLLELEPMSIAIKAWIPGSREPALLACFEK